MAIWQDGILMTIRKNGVLALCMLMSEIQNSAYTFNGQPPTPLSLKLLHHMLPWCFFPSLQASNPGVYYGRSPCSAKDARGLLFSRTGSNILWGVYSPYRFRTALAMCGSTTAVVSSLIALCLS